MRLHWLLRHEFVHEEGWVLEALRMNGYRHRVSWLWPGDRASETPK